MVEPEGFGKDFLYREEEEELEEQEENEEGVWVADHWEELLEEESEEEDKEEEDEEASAGLRTNGEEVTWPGAVSVGSREKEEKKAIGNLGKENYPGNNNHPGNYKLNGNEEVMTELHLSGTTAGAGSDYIGEKKLCSVNDKC